ncbi:ThiF family adenylyltransferase [Brevibacillus sp. B_LB10_24]|uniref:ThiF family adenylyltransferase n=1 Tax=Brevibacillus sp. B_LB10_24 TaxID=3380645 RepID=UPI0038B9C3AD
MDTEIHQRYSRQILFAPIGKDGQLKLLQSRVVIVGMGALGTVLANHMVRAGVGFVRIIDRDFVEESNLQRQMLYDEEDARAHLPKAVAAAAKLQKINSTVTVDPIVADLNATNAEAYLTGFDLILDGSDNFQVRYLVNDVAVKHKIPWIHGAAVSSKGMFAVIRPGETPCYRCLFPHPPEGRGETCDTTGVIGPIVHVIASYQAVEALKLLLGATQQQNPNLEQFELWQNDHLQINIAKGKNANCPACGQGVFEYLDLTAEAQQEFTSLCGRDTVQITPVQPKQVDLEELSRRFEQLGGVEKNPFLLRFHIDAYTLVFFKDGRVLVQGSQDISTARSLYAKYVGY